MQCHKTLNTTKSPFKKWNPNLRHSPANNLKFSSILNIRFSFARCHALQQYFVTCHPGLEQVVAQELQDLGAQKIEAGKSGVSFGGSQQLGYKACLWLRSAIRVLSLLYDGPLYDEDDFIQRGGEALYERVRDAAPWPEIIREGQSFSIDAHLHNCTDVSDRHFAWTQIKNAICDSLTDAGHRRPVPPEDNLGDVPVCVKLYNNRLMLYRDMTGSSLHKRGYRGPVIHKAMLNEAAAAGVLMLAGWPQRVKAGETVLADPMCGSATLLIEAGMMATNTAPNLNRQHWPFATWTDFEPSSWRQITTDAKAARRPWKGKLLGCDVHEGALGLAEEAISIAGLSGLVQLSHSNCDAWKPAAVPDLVVVNPPWGRRIAGESLRPGRAPNRSGGDARDEASPSSELEDVWLSLGSFLRESCAGREAFILAGDRNAVSPLRLKATRRYPLTLGDVQARLYHYELRASHAPQKANAW